MLCCWSMYLSLSTIYAVSICSLWCRISSLPLEVKKLIWNLLILVFLTSLDQVSPLKPLHMTSLPWFFFYIVGLISLWYTEGMPTVSFMLRLMLVHPLYDPHASVACIFLKGPLRFLLELVCILEQVDNWLK